MIRLEYRFEKLKRKRFFENETRNISRIFSFSKNTRCFLLLLLEHIKHRKKGGRQYLFPFFRSFFCFILLHFAHRPAVFPDGVSQGKERK